MTNLFTLLERSGLKKLLSDNIYLKIKYLKHYGRWPNLKNPTTFQEKMQWLKLNHRAPYMTQMVDKYEAKKYVAEKIGNDYIIPTLGLWNNVEDIDFETLPEQFVLKTTHDSGGIVICHDKNRLDVESAKKKLSTAIHRSGYNAGREWVYKDVQPRIIAEQYMTDGENIDLIDYKFYCFNGVPRYCQVIRDRNTAETIDFYDREWVHQEFIGLNQNANFSGKAMEKPRLYEQMLEIAAILSKNEPFLRVDLYYIHERIYFGEMTFYPSGGFGLFRPEKYNKLLGDLINLNL